MSDFFDFNAQDVGQLGMGLQVAGMVSGAFGSYFAASAQKSLLNAQAEIAEINARVAESQARVELLAGQRREQSSRLQTAAVKGRQRAAMAANGLDLGEGSAAEVLTSTDLVGEVDANTIHANAVRSAWGLRTQATSSRNEALMKRATADGISPGTAAASSLLGSAGTVAMSWYRLQKEGVFGSGGPYNYNDDVSGAKFSASGADVRARR